MYTRIYELKKLLQAAYSRLHVSIVLVEYRKNTSCKSVVLHDLQLVNGIGEDVVPFSEIEHYALADEMFRLLAGTYIADEGTIIWHVDKDHLKFELKRIEHVEYEGWPDILF